MQRGSHQPGDDRWVGLHEFPRRGFAISLEDHEAEGLVEGFLGATGKNDLSRACGPRQTLKVTLHSCIFGLGPRRFLLESRRNLQDVNVLLTRLSLLREERSWRQERESRYECEG